ncbi:MurR/RpiR family transcriptional regulator [Fictibacillus fluitans]|uniref:MurR/RpiR family transcriptional regulator n=1 Tax=Fictibacillus fluitans TaxID=3058422 RepID=A0ABT8HTD7_9BACL|nr:MurR/RpiR family transcriptional regulator [Fictibacillus sp. NE201]MDN4524035.1 MurR/RpiR family transcriptional regulator [Fictibacillus sp. NE201]
MSSLKELIKTHYENLTKLQKKVAKQILDDPKRVVLQTAKELGTEIGASETTIIRFCYAIGYDGYADLQENVRTELLIHKDKDALNKFANRMTDAETALSETAHTEMNQDLLSIQRTLEEFDHEQYIQIVNAIIKAKRVVVVGLRTSFAPAHWLSYTLNVVKGNTILYRGEVDDAHYILSDLNEEHLVIAFSFPRYATETISFVKAAKSKGAKVFALTDSELSPVAGSADYLIKVTTPEPSSIKGMPTIFSILNLFVTGIMKQDKSNVQKQLNKYRESSHLFHSYAASHNSREGD